MTEHTPGPWSYISGSVYVSNPDDLLDVSRPIAHMDREAGNGTFGAERDCNARLIAAAPKMDKALREIVEIGNMANARTRPTINQPYVRMRAVALLALDKE